jgi:hypothetical protein
MISNENSSGLATLAMDWRHHESLFATIEATVCRKLAGGVLDDDDRGVLDSADRDAQPCQRKEIDGLAEPGERQDGHQRAQQQQRNRANRRSKVAKKEDRHQGEDDQSATSVAKNCFKVFQIQVDRS